MIIHPHIHTHSSNSQRVFLFLVGSQHGRIYVRFYMCGFEPWPPPHPYPRPFYFRIEIITTGPAMPIVCRASLFVMGVGITSPDTTIPQIILLSKSSPGGYCLKNVATLAIFFCLGVPALYCINNFFTENFLIMWPVFYMGVFIKLRIFNGRQIFL